MAWGRPFRQTRSVQKLVALRAAEGGPGVDNVELWQPNPHDLPKPALKFVEENLTEGEWLVSLVGWFEDLDPHPVLSVGEHAA